MALFHLGALVACSTLLWVPLKPDATPAELAALRRRKHKGKVSRRPPSGDHADPSAGGVGEGKKHSGNHPTSNNGNSNGVSGVPVPPWARGPLPQFVSPPLGLLPALVGGLAGPGSLPPLLPASAAPLPTLRTPLLSASYTGGGLPPLSAYTEYSPSLPIAIAGGDGQFVPPTSSFLPLPLPRSPPKYEESLLEDFRAPSEVLLTIYEEGEEEEEDDDDEEEEEEGERATSSDRHSSEDSK
jgi:hypothetical protein